MNEQTLKLINKHLAKARKKHPIFAFNLAQFVCVLVEEIGEMAQAYNDGNIEKMQTEAADAMAVLVRFLEGDLNGGIE